MVLRLRVRIKEMEWIGMNRDVCGGRDICGGGWLIRLMGAIILREE